MLQQQKEPPMEIQKSEQPQSQARRIAIRELKKDQSLINEHSANFIQGRIINGFDRVDSSTPSSNYNQLFILLCDTDEDQDFQSQIQICCFGEDAARVFSWLGQPKSRQNSMKTFKFAKGKVQKSKKANKLEIKFTKKSIFQLLQVQKRQQQVCKLEPSIRQQQKQKNITVVNSRHINERVNFHQQLQNDRVQSMVLDRFGNVLFPIMTIDEVLQKSNIQDRDFKFIINGFLKHHNIDFMDRNKFFRVACKKCNFNKIKDSDGQNCPTCGSDQLNYELQIKVQVMDKASSTTLVITPRQFFTKKILGYSKDIKGQQIYNQMFKVDKLAFKEKLIQRLTFSGSYYILVNARKFRDQWYFNGEEIINSANFERSVVSENMKMINSLLQKRNEVIQSLSQKRHKKQMPNKEQKPKAFQNTSSKPNKQQQMEQPAFQTKSYFGWD